MPPTPDEYAAWRRPRLIAQLWCCNDEYDGLCYQPRIDRITANTIAGYPWVRREEVWRGEFVNAPDSSEMSRLIGQLRRAAHSHNIVLDDDFWGRR